jgi:type II secretory pathway component PulK
MSGQEAQPAREKSGAAPREARGIVLAIVLVMIFALITAVYAFQRRAIIDATISRNRLDASEADALAKGGLRIAEALVAIVHAKHVASALGGGGSEDSTDSTRSSDSGSGTGTVDALWQGIENFPLELEDDRRLRIQIEDEGAKLNLNALVAAQTSDPDNDTLALPDEPDDDSDSEGGLTAEEDAVEYLTAVLEYVVDGMEDSGQEKNYDTAKIAENLLDFIDGDSTAINGRSEDEYYRRQDPPYTAWNKPLVSVDQIGLVEDVDALLLAELRHYVTVHPIGESAGINLNRAEPWVLKLVYNGSSGNRRLIDDKLVEDLIQLRNKGQLVCDDVGAAPECISRADVGNGDFGNGDIYPEVALPAKPTVFRVIAAAQIGEITRRFEAVYDTRPPDGPQLLSWRRLRGND